MLEPVGDLPVIYGWWRDGAVGWNSPISYVMVEDVLSRRTEVGVGPNPTEDGVFAARDAHLGVVRPVVKCLRRLPVPRLSKNDVVTGVENFG